MPTTEQIQINEKGPGKIASIVIEGTSNAYFHQRVDIVITDANSNAQNHRLQGQGEQVVFPNKVILDNIPLPATIDFTFTFSSDGGNNWQDAVLSRKVLTDDAGNNEVYALFTEDATDKDDNDTYLVTSIVHN